MWRPRWQDRQDPAVTTVVIQILLVHRSTSRFHSEKCRKHLVCKLQFQNSFSIAAPREQMGSERRISPATLMARKKKEWEKEKEGDIAILLYSCGFFHVGDFLTNCFHDKVRQSTGGYLSWSRRRHFESQFWAPVNHLLKESPFVIRSWWSDRKRPTRRRPQLFVHKPLAHWWILFLQSLEAHKPMAILLPNFDNLGSTTSLHQLPAISVPYPSGETFEKHCFYFWAKKCLIYDFIFQKIVS